MNTMSRLVGFRSLRSKLIIMSLVMLILPSLITGLIGWQVARAQLGDQGKTTLQTDVHFVNSTIKLLNDQVTEGKLSLPQAQEQVKEMILGPMGSNGKRSITKAFNLGKSGYLFVVDYHGLEVAHPTMEGKNIWSTKSPDGVYVAQALAKAAQNGGAFVSYQWPLPNSKQTAPKIVYAQADPAGWGWVVCAGTYMSDFNSSANIILMDIIITLVVAIVLGLFFTILFAIRISRPVVAMEEQVTRVSNGDLAVKPLQTKGTDEIGRLTLGVNRMTENLKTLLSEISTTSEQVAAASEQLSASAEETGKATEQITLTIQEAATGAIRQSEHVDASKGSILRMSEGVLHIAENTNVVNKSSEDANAKTVAGNEAIQIAVQKMGQIHATVDGLSEVVEQLGNQSTEIGQIVDAITSIADQTNLLALNAAIEAARAGESGRGFAVVADEVRKLAEESGKSAQKISSLIQKIQQGTTHAVAETKNTSLQVNEGLQAVNQAGLSFEEIRTSISTVNGQIHEIANASKELSASSAQLNAAIEEVARVSDETTAGMQTVAASAEEQLASTEEISSSAAELTHMAENLQKIVSKFTI